MLDVAESRHGEVTLAGIIAAPALLHDIADADRPVVRFVRGHAGSGKSAILDAARQTLASNGISVRCDAAEHPAPGTALIVDDAHTLSVDARRRISDAVARGDVTVIVAAEPRRHDDGVRELESVLTAFAPIVDLAPLRRADVVERARAAGHDIAAPAAVRITEATGGVLGAVDHVLSQLDSTDPAAIEDSVADYFHAALRRTDEQAQTVLVIAASGVCPDPDAIAAVLNTDRGDAIAALDRARASGALTPTDALVRGAERAVRCTLGDVAIVGVAAALVDYCIGRGSLHVDTAVFAATLGVHSTGLADALAGFATDAPPADAMTLWASALTAGLAPEAAAVPYADAAALTGDLTTAARLADAALSDTDVEVRRGAVRVAASVAAARGTFSHSAELFRWVGPAGAGADAALGAVCLIATGDRTGAEEFLAAAESAPPTTVNARSRMLARGLRDSLTSGAAVALGSLLRSASLGAGARHRVEPESAVTVAALLCLHSGDPSGAHDVLTGALDREPAGSVAATRFRLLLAWTAMSRGDLATAQTHVDTFDAAHANQRDALLASVVHVGVARRRGDAGALVAAWKNSARIVAEAEVDLFSLLPIGELWLAAVRLGEIGRVRHLIDGVETLLTHLGEPAAWASTWHWYGVQAAILSHDPTALLPHARALRSAADSDAYATGLADAGRTWLRVLQDEATHPEVDASARTLERFGHVWDGARLASEAALRASDTAVATALLQTARQIGSPVEVAASRTRGDADAAEPVTGPLTGRESQVAELLVLGLTYREIGARLYISAKTVEHHVARIRRRLGAGSRSEMLSLLRAAGYSSDTQVGKS